MFNKVYIEITNNCNLNCPFCIHNKRKAKYMTIEEFKIILNKLKGYTKYLYLHVMGEPLLHPYINEIIDLASRDFYVNITTNGVLINKIKNNKNIRQINISLHSNYENTDEYMNNLFDACDKLKERTFINYRFWVDSNRDVIKYLEKKYDKKIIDSCKLEKNVFVDIKKAFKWPDLNNNINNESGKCYALKSHIGILVNGDIVPCCLDSKADILLGNIFNEKIDDVMNRRKVRNMIDGFKENKRVEKLCKHCGFNVERNNKI